MTTASFVVNFALSLYALLPAVLAFEPYKYLVISAPRLSKVVYMKIGDKGGQTRPLIDSGLKSPQGVAVDQKRQKLYVTDPDSRKIFSYNLVFNNGVLLTDGKQAVAAQNVEARWVAVDGVGSIFFTDERDNLIQKVSAEKILRGDPTPTVMYSGISVSQVSAPGGIATDNFHVFWTNKAVGTLVGSVVKGFETPPETNVAASVKAIAKNAVKVYGVCLSMNNVFYTDSESYVYAVKKTGGAIAEVTAKLLHPRGCTWDGDGTIYIADKGGNAVYSFPGNMHTLTPMKLTKTVDFEDAFGVAVISASLRARLTLTLALLGLWQLLA